MIFRIAIMNVCLIIACTLAWAGPEGTYDVTGKNPDSQSVYRGTVTVTRTGETYKVRWQIAGTQFIGSGIGAAPAKGNTIMGPADENDNVLAVGYVSGRGNFGLAYYIEQADGSWKGIWTFGGSEKIGTETWVPAQ